MKLPAHKAGGPYKTCGEAHGFVEAVPPCVFRGGTGAFIIELGLNLERYN